INVALQHLGEDCFWRYNAQNTYVLMTNSALANPSYAGPWDCAELVTYCVYRAYGQKFGLLNVDTSAQESSAGRWLADATTLTAQFIEITLAQASSTVGAILIATSGGHVAMSMGGPKMMGALAYDCDAPPAELLCGGLLLRGSHATAYSGGQGG